MAARRPVTTPVEVEVGIAADVDADRESVAAQPELPFPDLTTPLHDTPLVAYLPERYLAAIVEEDPDMLSASEEMDLRRRIRQAAQAALRGEML